jgi:PAS domain S-box-containing protein
MDYLTLNRELEIQETSLTVQRFADSPHEVKKGKDVRLAFPEFVGIEEILVAIYDGKINSFELKGIKRFSEPNPPLYLDVAVVFNKNGTSSNNKLFILFEDVTQQMLMEQTIAQAIRETTLLSSTLAQYKEYVDKIIDAMTDVLLVTTERGYIKKVNRAAKDLLEYSEAELINQHISDLIPDEKFLSNVVQQPCLPKKSLVKDVEVICQTKTGKEIVLAFSRSVIQTDIEALHNFVYIGRDISKRKQAEEEIRKALAKEKEISELKFRFFSMVTHEFGNPLNSILMSVALLEHYGQESTPEENLEYIHNIKTAANQMTDLLKDVLVINKAEAGKLKFNPAALDLVKLCSELVAQIKLAAGGKRTIIFAINNDNQGGQESNFLPCSHCMDENLLRHILTNLLSNAVKYSPEGSTVYFDLNYQEQSVIFKIKDEGIGITSEDQKRLFELFHRGKNVGKIPGTGLGLSIVKQALDLHGGKILVESAVGVGTTFTVTIPLSHGIL